MTDTFYQDVARWYRNDTCAIVFWMVSETGEIECGLKYDWRRFGMPRKEMVQFLLTEAEDPFFSETTRAMIRCAADGLAGKRHGGLLKYYD